MHAILRRRDLFLESVLHGIAIGQDEPNLSRFINSDVTKDYKDSEYRHVSGGWFVKCQVEDYESLVLEFSRTTPSTLAEKSRFRLRAIHILGLISGILRNKEKPALRGKCV